jgi:hypothetical protein
MRVFIYFTEINFLYYSCVERVDDGIAACEIDDICLECLSLSHCIVDVCLTHHD